MSHSEKYGFRDMRISRKHREFGTATLELHVRDGRLHRYVTSHERSFILSEGGDPHEQ